MQGGNDVDYPGVISTSCQRSRCAVIGRPAGRRGESKNSRLSANNNVNSKGCIKDCRKSSRIQEDWLKHTMLVQNVKAYDQQYQAAGNFSTGADL